MTESFNELLNHEPVYRTAPATPGLLYSCRLPIALDIFAKFGWSVLDLFSVKDLSYKFL